MDIILTVVALLAAIPGFIMLLAARRQATIGNYRAAYEAAITCVAFYSLALICLGVAVAWETP